MYKWKKSILLRMLGRNLFSKKILQSGYVWLSQELMHLFTEQNLKFRDTGFLKFTPDQEEKNVFLFKSRFHLTEFFSLFIQAFLMLIQESISSINTPDLLSNPLL